MYTGFVYLSVAHYSLVSGSPTKSIFMIKVSIRRHLLPTASTDGGGQAAYLGVKSVRRAKQGKHKWLRMGM